MLAKLLLVLGCVDIENPNAREHPPPTVLFTSRGKLFIYLNPTLCRRSAMRRENTCAPREVDAVRGEC